MVARAYPRLADFNRLRAGLDPGARFGNAFTDSRLEPA
jgi:hypothetical protein